MKAAVVHIYVEEIQGSLFAWEEGTDQFLGQGTSVTSLFQRLKLDMPDDSMRVFKARADRGGLLLAERGLAEYQDEQAS
jgi:hypothetical protein